MEDYFAILEISAGASEPEIRKAYRRLARKYHPDVSKEPDAEEKFIRITEAYQGLTEKRSFVGITVDTINPVINKEELRRERARQYARMRYEQFRESSLAFKRSWYFMPLKISTLVLIYSLYLITVLIVLSPLIAWIVTRSGRVTFGFGLLAIVSSHVYQLARMIQKETKPYFEDWEN